MCGTAELERFSDESIKHSIEKRYNPTVFVGMRRQYGTREAIKRLVVNGYLQRSLRRMEQLGILDWSIEAAVLKFPRKFEHGVQEAAKFRLDQARASTKGRPEKK
jgi:hypothetical protein